MKRTPARVAVVSAMTAAIALGTVSAAEAKPAPKASHSKQAHENKSHEAKSHHKKSHEDKARAAAKKLAAVKAHVARDAAKKSTALSRVEAKVVRADLGAENTASIKSNIAADKAALSDAAANVATVNNLSDAYKAAAVVAAYRPEVYEQVRTILAIDGRLGVKAEGLNAAIADLTAKVAEKKADGADVAAIEATLADATTATFASVSAAGTSEDKALTVHANTPKRGADSALYVAKTEARKAAAAAGQAADKVEAAKAALTALDAPAPTAPAARR